MGLLSLAIWTPIFFGVVLLALGRDEQARAVRWIALIGAVVSLLVTLPLYDAFRWVPRRCSSSKRASLDRALQRATTTWGWTAFRSGSSR
jgi:NADH:ubiquinone oxidoreductase subunit 4 (subunit M)